MIRGRQFDQDIHRINLKKPIHIFLYFIFNRYRRKRPKVDASIFDSAVSDTRRPDASEKREENSVENNFWRFSPVDNFRVLACIG